MIKMWMIQYHIQEGGRIAQPTVFSNLAHATAFCNDDEIVVPVYVLSETEYTNLTKAANNDALHADNK